MGVFNDEFEGQGGSYIMKNGKRVRVEETPAAAPAEQKNDAPVVEQPGASMDQPTAES